MPRKPPTFSLRPPGPVPPGNRPSAHRRGYTHDWRKLRLLVLAEEPLCRHCRHEGRTVAAEHVDHDVPLGEGGTNDRANLVPLCHACHSYKTVSQDGGLGRRRPTRQSGQCQTDVPG